MNLTAFHDQQWTEDDKLCNSMALFPEILRSCTTTIIGSESCVISPYNESLNSI